MILEVQDDDRSWYGLRKTWKIKNVLQPEDYSKYLEDDLHCRVLPEIIYDPSQPQYDPNNYEWHSLNRLWDQCKHIDEEFRQARYKENFVHNCYNRHSFALGRVAEMWCAELLGGEVQEWNVYVDVEDEWDIRDGDITTDVKSVPALWPPEFKHKILLPNAFMRHKDFKNDYYAMVSLRHYPRDEPYKSVLDEPDLDKHVVQGAFMGRISRDDFMKHARIFSYAVRVAGKMAGEPLLNWILSFDTFRELSDVNPSDVYARQRRSGI